MPPHEGRNSRLVTTADETLQQLAIGQVGLNPGKHGPAKAVNQVAQLVLRHIKRPLAGSSSPYLLLPGRGHFIDFSPPGSQVSHSPYSPRSRRHALASAPRAPSTPPPPAYNIPRGPLPALPPHAGPEADPK
jgi:hypothetical protein